MCRFGDLPPNYWAHSSVCSSGSLKNPAGRISSDSLTHRQKWHGEKARGVCRATWEEVLGPSESQENFRVLLKAINPGEGAEETGDEEGRAEGEGEAVENLEGLWVLQQGTVAGPWVASHTCNPCTGILPHQ